MKKICIALLVLLTSVQFSHAQWSTGTGTIYPTTLTDKVGIGINNPNSTLHVVGSGTTGQITIGDSNNSNYLRLYSQGVLTQSIISSNGSLSLGSNSNTADVVISNGGNFNFNSGQVYFQKSNGRVGIGTTTPGQRLDVTDIIASTPTIRVIGSNTANYASLQVGQTSTSVGSRLVLGNVETGGKRWDINNGGLTTGALSLQNNTDGLTAMTILSNGNIGIGTTSINRGKVEILQTTNTVNGGIAVVNSAITGSVRTWVDNNGIGRIDNAAGNLSLNASSGFVGIGTTSPNEKLTVKGKIHSEEVVVDMNVLPDYVFHPTYKLADLKDVERYVNQNHHLPEVPSAKEVAKDGLKLGQMNAILLKKVEELTLYLIEKDKQLEQQQKELAKTKRSLQSQINKLSKKIK